MITANMVKELREQTGAGMLDCKKALTETNGNMEEAVTWLREKGISKAAKKQTRIAAEGLALAKVEGNKAVIVEVNSETDFVAKNDEFKELVSNLAKLIVAKRPADVEALLATTCDKCGKKVEDIIKEKVATIGEKITVSYYKGKQRQTDTVAVAKNGNFTYESAECVADALTVGQQQLLLFMRPGSQLEINLDIRDAENWKAVFKGDYAAENDYQFI